MISRRKFLQTTSCIAGLGVNVNTTEAVRSAPGYYGLHPFIDNHPEAVFIMRTHVDVKTNHDAKLNAGLEFSRSVFVPRDESGLMLSTEIPVKPNMKSVVSNKLSLEDLIGMGTDPYFVEGVIEGIKEFGVAGNRFHIREVNHRDGFEAYGHVAMAKRTGADLRLDFKPEVKNLETGRDYNWTNVPHGIWYKKIPHLEPVNTPGSWLLNIAKFKGHGMGVTLCCKNIQGTIAHNYQQFCCRFDDDMKMDPAHMHGNAKEVISANYRRHLKEGIIPRWDKPGPYGGIWQETWATRTLDHLSVTTCGINIIEGIYGRDGNGSTSGPHPLDRKHEYNESRAHSRTGKPKDYMSNIIIFGKNPFRTDIIGHWLAGHEPGNFGLFHLALERGMLDVLDPLAIPVYLWENGTEIMTPLEEFERTPLVCYYLTRNYNGQSEPMYHLVDDPFDYSAMTSTVEPILPEKPAVLKLTHGMPTYPFKSAVFEFRLPRSGQVRLEIFNKEERLIDVLTEGQYDAGCHMAAWNTGNHPPGEYYCRMRFEGNDTAERITLLK